MKHYIVCLVMLLMPLTTLAQSVETWFELVKFVDGFTDEVAIHVQTNNAASAANEELRKQIDKLSRDMDLGPVEALDPGLRGAGAISLWPSPVWIGLAYLGREITALRSP